MAFKALLWCLRHPRCYPWATPSARDSWSMSQMSQCAACGQTSGQVGPRASAMRTAAKRSKPAETFVLSQHVS